MTLTNRILAALPAPPSLRRGNALFLDVDGTLCAIAPRPTDVAFDAALQQILGAVSTQLSGAVALVSGRALDWLSAEAGDLPLALAGTHGLEIRHADGRLDAAPVRPGLAAAIDSARQFAATNPGVVIETKARAVAIHYRQAPESAAAVTALAEMLSRRHGLPLQHGTMVAELKGGDGDKGRAIASLLAGQPFRDRLPIYVGDDLTDEAGFAAVAAAGGYGILVGAPRDTAADYGLADPAAVRHWLGDVA